MVVKPYYTTIKETKYSAYAELKRHLLDDTCCQALQPHDFESNMLTNRRDTGFGTGCSCIQKINILSRIMDGAHSQNIPLFITFVDFKILFDSIDRDILFDIVQHY